MNEKVASQIELKAAKESLEGQSLEKFFSSFQIPEEKVDTIAEHFQKLRKKFPHMNMTGCLKRQLIILI